MYSRKNFKIELCSYALKIFFHVSKNNSPENLFVFKIYSIERFNSFELIGYSYLL